LTTNINFLRMNGTRYVENMTYNL